ncbi:hypothetical protein SD70_18555 [Gordoniibacillus kamchatkensis]|uniref:MYXO-CTERM domain-containing protein n=1 Tax=Gordoniibacillus kamchatkensis TaxID=1590651 RepID=A0ABR5AF58_9BACL|nr:hypothetical protein [Paenibacillus sp. VKM B-2647]KIL39649.1 hypothetical protein SD70_18555 [Paenibacillus sp. VKM B-2647]
MRKIGFWLALLLVQLPEAAWAHEGEGAARRAPDLHPLFVLAEFAVVLWAGLRIAGWLSRIGRPRNEERRRS